MPAWSGRSATSCGTSGRLTTAPRAVIQVKGDHIAMRAAHRVSRRHITSVVDQLVAFPDSGAYAQVVATEHWRLSRLFPDGVALATKPYTDLLHSEISAATDAGVLRSSNPEHDAWLTSQLVMSVFHHHSCSAETDPTLAADLWRY